MGQRVGLSWNKIAISMLIAGQTFVTPYMVFASGSDVKLAGETVIVSQVSIGGMTAEQRADVIQTNLDNALIATKDRSPKAVSIVYVKGSPVILLGGYRIMEVDTASAKAAGMTPALLAQKWADAIRNVLADQASVRSYVAQITGYFEANTVAQSNNAVAVTQEVTNPVTGNYQKGRVVYAPAGLTIPITLQTSISTQAAKAGDLVQAAIPKAILLGESQIPAGTTVSGIVADASEGKLLGKAASLTVKFNRLRLPDGSEQPITAHLVGNIGKYATDGAEDTLKGETWKTKAGQAAIRGAIGAGTGAALGTAVGAVAGGKRGTGRGAWSGAAIGSGVGVAQSLLLRKGKEVTLESGTALQLQLDAPLSLAGAPDKYTY